MKNITSIITDRLYEEIMQAFSNGIKTAYAFYDCENGQEFCIFVKIVTKVGMNRGSREIEENLEGIQVSTVEMTAYEDDVEDVVFDSWAEAEEYMQGIGYDIDIEEVVSNIFNYNK